jgi:hypothetical protein
MVKFFAGCIIGFFLGIGINMPTIHATQGIDRVSDFLNGRNVIFLISRNVADNFLHPSVLH